MADGVMISQLGRATEILGTDKIEIERDGLPITPPSMNSSLILALRSLSRP